MERGSQAAVGPNPSARQGCSNRLWVCGVCREKRARSPSLNSELGGAEPGDGAGARTPQAGVMQGQHSSFQSSPVWGPPLKMASW